MVSLGDARFTMRHYVAMLVFSLSCCLDIFAQQADSFDRGVALFKSREYAKAAQVLATVMPDHPRSLEAQLFLGKAFTNLGKFEEAEVALRRYLVVEQTSEDGLYLYAFTLFRLNRARESLAAFAHAAKLKSPTPDDLKIIGLNYVLLGDDANAARCFEQALAAAPGNLEIHYYLGRVRFTLNDFEEAKRHFAEVLRHDPTHVKAQNNLGQTFEAQNDSEGAMQAYRRAIELDRNSSHASELPLLNLGMLLSAQSRFADALPLLARATTVNPVSAKARFELAKVYLRLNRQADAEKQFVEASRLDPKDVGVRYQLGLLYKRTGRRELARREFDLAEQLRADKNR